MGSTVVGNTPNAENIRGFVIAVIQARITQLVADALANAEIIGGSF
jgi:hypothetical protein